MESSITIECGNIKLEGSLRKNRSLNAVVVCHPHPLYGGNMDNPVVMAIADSFFEKNITPLRFNFRGTCNSTGMFDNGKGEQEDIRAAIAWLKEEGYEKIYLAGYSFGAKMNALVVSKGCDIEDHIMVSPPVGFMSFDDIEKLPCTGLIITGADDEIGPADMVQGHINRWRIDPQYEIIKGCDHFYSNSLDRLKTILTDYVGVKS